MTFNAVFDAFRHIPGGAVVSDFFSSPRTLSFLAARHSKPDGRKWPVSSAVAAAGPPPGRRRADA
jgi:hypothetical protein